MLNFYVTESQYNLIVDAIKRKMGDEIRLDSSVTEDASLMNSIKEEYSRLASSYYAASSDCVNLMNKPMDLSIAVRIVFKDYMIRNRCPKAAAVYVPNAHSVLDAACAVDHIIKESYREATDWQETARQKVSELGPIEQALFAWSVL